MKTVGVVLGLCLCLVLTPESAWADCVDYGVYPHLLGSVQTDFVGHDFAISGTLLFAAESNNGLHVIDISNPDAPVVVGSLGTTSFTLSVAADERYAYLTVAYSGLWIIDVADPAHPVLASIVPSPSYAYGVAIRGDLAYFTDREHGLYVVDVSDRTAPLVVGQYEILDDDTRGIAIEGSHAYLVRDHSRVLSVVDVSDPTTPTLVANAALPGHPQEIAISGNHAYIADGEVGLTIVDISNPAAPVVMGSFPPREWASNVVVDGSFAFVMDYDRGLIIVDISLPDHPVASGVFNVLNGGTAVAVADGRAYLDSPGGGYPYRRLLVVDVSQPRPVEILGTVGLPYDGMRIDAMGSFAYAATWQDGLSVIDATNPTSPRIVGHIRPLSDPSHVYSDVDERDGYVYLAFGDYYIIIRVEDPEHPLLQRSLSMDGCEAAASAFSGNYAFLLDTCDRLWAADVAAPAQAQLLGHIWMDDRPGARDVAVVGRYAYVGGQDHMDIVDTADPAHLTLAATFQTPCPVVRMAAAGSYLYLVCRDSFCIVDVANPLFPSARGCVGIPGTLEDPLDVSVKGSYAYVSDSGAGLQVIDVSDPDNPRIAGLMGDVRMANAVAATESYLFEIDEDQVVVLPIQCAPAAAPDETSLLARSTLAASPQPAGGEISVRFHSPHGEAVSLDVTDAAGRRIRSLYEGSARPGMNEIRWDGRDDAGRHVESGVYFIRMQSEGRREAARAVVLR